MKKLAIFALCFVVIFSLFSYNSNSNFSLKDYVNNISTIERPTMPTLTLEDGSNILEIDPNTKQPLNFFGKCGAFFTFVFNCVCYPFALIGYYFNLVIMFLSGFVAV